MRNTDEESKDAKQMNSNGDYASISSPPNEMVKTQPHATVSTEKSKVLSRVDQSSEDKPVTIKDPSEQDALEKATEQPPLKSPTQQQQQLRKPNISQKNIETYKRILSATDANDGQIRRAKNEKNSGQGALFARKGAQTAQPHLQMPLAQQIKPLLSENGEQHKGNGPLYKNSIAISQSHLLDDSSAIVRDREVSTNLKKSNESNNRKTSRDSIEPLSQEPFMNEIGENHVERPQSAEQFTRLLQNRPQPSQEISSELPQQQVSSLHNCTEEKSEPNVVSEPKLVSQTELGQDEEPAQQVVDDYNESQPVLQMKLAVEEKEESLRIADDSSAINSRNEQVQSQGPCSVSGSERPLIQNHQQSEEMTSNSQSGRGQRHKPAIFAQEDVKKQISQVVETTTDNDQPSSAHHLRAEHQEFALDEKVLASVQPEEAQDPASDDQLAQSDKDEEPRRKEPTIQQDTPNLAESGSDQQLVTEDDRRNQISDEEDDAKLEIEESQPRKSNVRDDDCFSFEKSSNCRKSPFRKQSDSIEVASSRQIDDQKMSSQEHVNSKVSAEFDQQKEESSEHYNDSREEESKQLLPYQSSNTQSKQSTFSRKSVQNRKVKKVSIKGSPLKSPRLLNPQENEQDNMDERSNGQDQTNLPLNNSAQVLVTPTPQPALSEYDDKQRPKFKVNNQLQKQATQISAEKKRRKTHSKKQRQLYADNEQNEQEIQIESEKKRKNTKRQSSSPIQPQLLDSRSDSKLKVRKIEVNQKEQEDYTNSNIGPLTTESKREKEKVKRKRPRSQTKPLPIPDKGRITPQKYAMSKDKIIQGNYQQEKMSYWQKVKKCCKKKKKQTPEELQKRSKYLWRMLRLRIRSKNLFLKDSFVDSSDFGLDSDVSRSIDEKEARKIRDVVVQNEGIKRKMKGLAWYLIDKNSTFAIIQNNQIQIMTWSTMIITPLCIVFPTVKARLNYFEWFVDCSWALEIFINFFTAEYENDTFVTIAKRQFASGVVFINAFATFPPMIFKEQSDLANMLKFLRVYHFTNMFTPFHLLIEFMMYDSDTKKIQNIQQFTMLITSVILLAHFFACGWITIGRIDCSVKVDLELNTTLYTCNPEKDRCQSWVCAPDSDFNEYNDYQLFVFAYYWIWEVITTVGYGDYSGTTETEMIFSVILEFVGLAFFSILMGLITGFFQPQYNFDALIAEQMSQLDIWIQKLERSSGHDHNFISPKLYYDITKYINDAFSFDFNLIVEEFDFYNQLSSSMQTELITLIFSDFKREFRCFFEPVSQGFANEFIINMYTRISTPQSYLIFPNRIVTEIYFIKKGQVGICDARGRGPHIILPNGSYFGDYQILFELKSQFTFKTLSQAHVKDVTMPFISKKDEQKKTKADEEDNDDNETFCMCVKAKLFTSLCELYPETAINLKFRALERRQNFMEQMQRATSNNVLAMKTPSVYKQNVDNERQNLIAIKQRIDTFPKNGQQRIKVANEVFDQLIFPEDEKERDYVKEDIDTTLQLAEDANDFMSKSKAKLHILAKEIEEGSVEIKRVRQPSKLIKGLMAEEQKIDVSSASQMASQLSSRMFDGKGKRQTLLAGRKFSNPVSAEQPLSNITSD